MFRSLLVFSLAGSLLALHPAQASAQVPVAENVAAARALGIRGVQLADDGKCAEAIAPLERAEALYHAPSILGRLGECQVALGQLVLGTETLNRTVREPLGPGAPQAFREAQARAQKVLDAALPRIARLVIHVEPPHENAKVTIGNAVVPPALLGAERPTDPGTHRITAVASGFLQAESTITLAEGSRREVTLVLERDPRSFAASVPPPAIATSKKEVLPASAPAAKPSSGSNTAGLVLLGVGAAGLAVGSVAGVLAIRKESELDCPRNECSGAETDALDRASDMALVSTVGFGVGIAGVVAATVLLLTGGDDSESTPHATRSHSWTARPFVRGRSLGLEGRF